MHRLWIMLCAAILIALVRPAAAQETVAASCLPHLAAAERYYRMPRGLLFAVALTESGWQGRPHPWTLNVEGQPVYLNGAADMRTALSAAARKTDRVAVGCMQIYLKYHPHPDPLVLSDPRYNVWYGARFLDELHARHGNWSRAVARYHAGPQNVLAQRIYVCKVLRNFHRIRGGNGAEAARSGC